MLGDRHGGAAQEALGKLSPASPLRHTPRMTRRRHKRPFPRISRRGVLAGLAAIAAAPVYGQVLLDGTDAGLAPNLSTDQTAALRAALERAVAEGRPLFLAAGEYRIDGLEIPPGVTVIGVQGQTRLLAAGSGPAARIVSSRDVVLEALTFMRAPEARGPGEDRGLLEIELSRQVELTRCRFAESNGFGLVVLQGSASIDRCSFEGLHNAAIFSRDSIGGIVATNNQIEGCGNGGILIWGSEPGHSDGSIILGNKIRGIYAEGGGNGQNGNGVNVFNADNVIVADNQIDGCAFTAVRCNATRNAQIRGNICTRCGEVAIFSEFGFSGSVIAGNTIDGAATGISMTNLDSGGRLAVCSGNIVRNIIDASPVNPDTRPVGIFAEADTAITGNTVDTVPGVGIMAGWGPYLRNVVVANNVVTAARTGIAVSVVTDPAPGPVRVDGNIVAGPMDYAIAGMAWEEVVSDDLVRDARKYPHVTIGSNTISRT